MKHKVGDMVVITGNKAGHNFQDGDLVTIRGIEGNLYSAFDGDGGVWYFYEGDCESVDTFMESQRDAVNHPTHYGQGFIECIDYIEDFLTREEYIGYLRGNIAKYMHRFRYKNGVEDVEKARWYTERLIETLRKEA